MHENDLELLTRYLNELKDGGDAAELDSKYSTLFDTDNEPGGLKSAVYSISHELSRLREQVKKASQSAIDKLTDDERAELAKVKGLIDNNLFTYHFQPIVRADTGEIFSYEALMRSGDIEGITPFHILKYAEFMDRLGEIEQYTFTNMLEFIGNNKKLFDGRLVFINSMPSVKISPDKAKQIEQMLGELSDIVVVEMTEQSEFTDKDLNEIKEKFSRLGIRIAIDDYGTGYSNISNLLRYTPNFVKIDRSLLSGIQDNPNKKHFVREIIDFCHDNGIMALAEGVENSEELRTVILLGADLIQGFYTARPSAKLLESLPYDIRSEIKICREEREHGKRMKIYHASAGERVALDKLTKEAYSSILVGGDYHEGTVTVTGKPYLDTQIHIVVAEGFNGSLSIKHAHLSNDVKEPCIDIGTGSRCTLFIDGDNRLDNSGIRVPKGASLTVEGNGLLEIFLGNSNYYGIGNSLECAHGELIFKHNALIRIKSTSHSGVCIGSGLGGGISIFSGEYELEAHGNSGVCLGAYDGDAELNIQNCDLEARAAGSCSAAIGSLNGSSRVKISQSSIRCYGYSQTLSVIGSVNGGRSETVFENASITIHANGKTLTACGSLYGDSAVTIEGCTFRAFGDGTDALMIGGMKGSSALTVTNADVEMNITTQLGVCTLANDENITVSGGKVLVRLDGEETLGVPNKR